MVLQDKKETVVGSQLNSLPALKRTEEEPDFCSVESTPSFLESWTIKFERTVNVLLLVCYFLVLYSTLLLDHPSDGQCALSEVRRKLILLVKP